MQLLLTKVSATNGGLRFLPGTGPVAPITLTGLSDQQIHETLSKCLTPDVNGKWAVRITTVAEDTAITTEDINWNSDAKYLLGYTLGVDANGDTTLVLAQATPPA